MEKNELLGIIILTIAIISFTVGMGYFELYKEKPDWMTEDMWIELQQQKYAHFWVYSKL